MGFGPQVPTLLRFEATTSFYSLQLISLPSVVSQATGWLIFLAPPRLLSLFFFAMPQRNTNLRNCTGLSITYIVSATNFYCLGLRDPSLVYANIVNLCARILYCLIFVDAYFKKATSTHFRFYKVLPPWELWVTSLTSAAVIHVSERRLNWLYNWGEGP